MPCPPAAIAPVAPPIPATRVGGRLGYDGMWFVLVLDQTRHLLGSVGDALVGEREMEQPSERIGVAAFGHGAQYPSLELVVHLVGRVFDRADFGCESLIAEQ